MDNNGYEDDDLSSTTESDSTTSSYDSSIEQGGADRTPKEHKRFQAYVVTMKEDPMSLVNSHFVRVKSTSVKGAAAKAITRAVQSPRVYKENKKGNVRQNRLVPYPNDIKSAVQKGKNVFVFIRGINKVNKPLRSYAYVGSLVKQDTQLENVGFKYKAKLFSLDMNRTKVVHELNKLASKKGYRETKNGKIPCKKMSADEIVAVYDEPRQQLKELSTLGNKALKQYVFPDYTETEAATRIVGGNIVARN